MSARDVALDRWGRIDVLVNAAGGNMPAATVDAYSFFELSTQALDDVVRLNLNGTLLPIRVFGEAMLAEPFPEGGRSAEGLREFKEGPAFIAIKAGVPVVPVAIVGMRELLPMGSYHLRSGDVVLRVGDPIFTKEMKASDRAELTERLYREVSRLLALD